MSQMHKGIAVGVVLGILAFWVWQRRSGGVSSEGG